MKKITNPRQLAVLTLNRLEDTEDFLREVLDLHIRENNLSDLDQGLFTELVYGTVRMQRNLDYILGKHSKRPLQQLEPVVLNNLRIAVYQIHYLDRVPDSAAVNEGVNLARLFRHQGVANFTNGILREVVRNKERVNYPSAAKSPVAHLGLKYSYPDWIIEEWINKWGFSEAEQLCQSMNQPPELHLRTNTLKIQRGELQEYFLNKGIEVKPGRYSPDILRTTQGKQILQDPGLTKGYYYIQDESSALAAHALQVQPGQLVYDLCSAPGGKTTHLAQLMNNQGQVWAFDLNPTRLNLVQENSDRLGISIVSTRVGDATKALNLQSADRVLVDAPCSGLGTMRHRPDIRWRKNPKDLGELARIQKQILKTAANYVDKSGLLVYSTCTLTTQENEDIVQWFLSDTKGFVPHALPTWFPESTNEPEWYRTFLPHIHGLDGFFVAVFRKL